MTLAEDLNHSWSLSDWLDYLEHQHPVAIDLGLERIGQVARQMGLDSLPMPVITVAGTNGKGSTCSLLEQLLSRAGYRVGVYSSPHLIDYRERVRIDGQLPDSDSFCQAFRAIESARAEIGLTYFEVGTLAALWLFKREQPDFVILEVGLGGRLDATNIIDANVAVVTTIALDHIDYLGSDLMQIGREKAGIFRAGGKAVIGDPAVVVSVVETAQALNCELLHNGHQVSAEHHQQSWDYRGRALSYSDLPYPMLPLDNAVAALAATEQLGITLTQQQVQDALAHWTLAGRMQQISHHPDVYLDVAHNPQSAGYLAQQLRRLSCTGRTIAVCAMLSDKDNQASVDALSGQFEQWFIAGLYGPRGDNGDKLAEALKGQPVARFSSVNEAYQAALAETSEADRVVVFGSFHTVAAVLSQQTGV